MYKKDMPTRYPENGFIIQYSINMHVPVVASVVAEICDCRASQDTPRGEQRGAFLASHGKA